MKNSDVWWRPCEGRYSSPLLPQSLPKDNLEILSVVFKQQLAIVSHLDSG